MCIYLVVNVENLKLYEPSMLMRMKRAKSYLPLKIWHQMHKKITRGHNLQKKIRMTKRGQQELWQVGLKGQLPTKAKWYSKEKVEELFPHLLQN
jgi:hypothetical protein